MTPNPTTQPGIPERDGDDAEKREQLLEQSNGTAIPYIETKSFRATAPQVVATWAQSWLLLELGMMINTPVIVLGALHKNPDNGDFQLSDSEASWFASILLILEPVGGLFSGFLQDVLGRKKCMALVNVPQLIGWLLLYRAGTAGELFVAAFCLGFSIGFMEAPVLSYVGEICQPRLRGTLASFTSLHVTLGLLLMNLLGHSTDWRTAALITSALPIISTIAILLVPESPVWLLMKDRNDDAMKALCWLRGWVKPENVMPEYKAMERHVSASKISATDENRSMLTKLVDKGKDIMRPEMRGPFKLILTFFFFAHCGGLSCTRPYVIRIAKDLGITMDPYLVTVFGGVLHMVGCLVCMIILRKFGKRRMSLFSMAACVIVAFSLATYSLLHESQELHYPWIPLALLLALYLFTSLGIFIIPWALLSEIFPARGRGVGGGLSSAIYYVMFFAVTKTFLDLEKMFHLHGVLYFYGAIGTMGILYLYFNLPETEGKTLEEVEKFFVKKQKDKPNTVI